MGRCRYGDINQQAIPPSGKHLVSCDYLRTQPEAARDYERLKRELTAKHRNDREAYTDAKADFIGGIIAVAHG